MEILRQNYNYENEPSVAELQASLAVAEETISFALEPKECFSVSSEYFSKNKELNSGLNDILENPKISKAGHDFKRISKYFI